MKTPRVMELGTLGGLITYVLTPEGVRHQKPQTQDSLFPMRKQSAAPLELYNQDKQMTVTLTLMAENGDEIDLESKDTNSQKNVSFITDAIAVAAIVREDVPRLLGRNFDRYPSEYFKESKEKPSQIVINDGVAKNLLPLQSKVYVTGKKSNIKPMPGLNGIYYFRDKSMKHPEYSVSYAYKDKQLIGVYIYHTQ